MESSMERAPKRFIGWIVGLTLAIEMLLIPGVKSASAQTNYEENAILLKFTTTAANQLNIRVVNGIVQPGISSLNALSQQCRAQRMERIFRPAGELEARHIRFGLNRFYKVTFPAGTNAQSFLARFAADRNVEAAQLSRLYVLYDNLPNDERLSFVPNDPLFTNQWHYHNTGQTGGTPDADIDAPEAWDIETGDPSVIVSDLDTGQDMDHPDLAANLWTNPGETPGNGLDDDGNGYVDDVHGWDFSDGDNNPDDYHNHGTHTAGAVAAVTNNGIGVAGVAFNSKVMACKIFPNASDPVIVEALTYAADNGSIISTNSWGNTMPAPPSPVLEAAIDYFLATTNGVVIFAAGNDNTDDPTWGYPASYPPVIAVAATDHNDVKASFSNYGTWVDVSAPGVNVFSTIIGGYAYDNGTSMSCPDVAGVAALLFAAHPGWSGVQVRSRLEASTDNIYPLNPGYAGLLGTGRVNARKALVLEESVAQIYAETYPGHTLPPEVDDSGMYYELVDGRLQALAFYAATDEFSLGGTYQEGDERLLSRIDAADPLPGPEVELGETGTGNFGFWIKSHGGVADGSKYYTERVRNPGAMDRFRVYQTPNQNEWFFAFENWIDYDFNDLVFVVKGISLMPSTPAGDNVTVEPIPGINVNFSTVTTGGNTTVFVRSAGHQVPQDFDAGASPTFYEIRTSASYQGPVTVAIDYDESQFFNENNLRLLHYEGDRFVDRTVAVNKTDNVVSAEVTALSEFIVTERAFVLYAEREVEIRECDGSEGNVGSNGEILVLRGAPSTTAVNLKALGNITILRDNTIDGDVISNASVSLDPNSTVTGTITEHADLPLILIPKPTFSAGGENIVVPKGGARVVDPGSYGAVALYKFGRLYLRSGNYYFQSLYLDQDSDILMDLSGGVLNVNVVGALTMGDEAALAIEPANSGATRDVRFTILHDGEISIGNSSTLLGTLLAPYGHVNTSSEIRLKGAIYADAITGLKRALFLPHSSTQTLPKHEALAQKNGQAGLPTTCELEQNHPNPFNPETEIRFQLPASEHVTLTVFNLLGKKVQTLTDEDRAAGYHSVIWDGKDEHGRQVASGVYLYQLHAGEFSQVRKMSLLR